LVVGESLQHQSGYEVVSLASFTHGAGGTAALALCVSRLLDGGGREALVGEGTALWFGASGFEVLTSVHGEVEVTIEVQSTATIVGCSGCGVRATAKDRRWVTVRDAPAGNVAVVVRWHKRIWACCDADCAVKTWTEQATWAPPRRSLSVAAQRWATAAGACDVDREARGRRGVGHRTTRRGAGLSPRPPGAPD
jgi:hypothetical protein